MTVQPYLFFDGKCEEALEFYKKAIGAKVDMLMRWKDSPDKSMATPGNADKVMHASFQIGERLFPSGRVEHIVFLDLHPGQRQALGIEFVAQLRRLLLAREQRAARRQPFFARHDRMGDNRLVEHGDPPISLTH